MKAKSPRGLLRLWGTAWEYWKFSQLPEAPLKLSPLGEEKFFSDSILAIPARQVIALNFWVDSTDSASIKSSVALELEIRGFRGPSDDLFSTARMWEEEGRTLVAISFFLPAVLGAYSDAVFLNYEASPLLLELEEDTVSLWKEEENWVAAFTRGKRVVYWMTFNNEKELGELEIGILQLVSSGILPSSPRKVVLAQHQLSSFEGFNSERVVKSSSSEWLPTLDFAKFGWKPDLIRQKETLQKARHRTRKMVAVVTGGYLGILLLAMVYLGWLRLDNYFLGRQERLLNQQVSEFRPAIREWQLVAPSVESERFPLENLHRIVENMPDEGIQLIVYEVSDDQILLEGEAVSALLASQLFTSITSDSDLKHIRWEMPPPSLLPSNAAKFQIKGTLL